MGTAPSRVHLIVAADYGERIRELPRDEPAWVADTPANAPVIRAVCDTRPNGTLALGLGLGLDLDDTWTWTSDPALVRWNRDHLPHRDRL